MEVMGANAHRCLLRMHNVRDLSPSRCTRLCCRMHGLPHEEIPAGKPACLSYL